MQVASVAFVRRVHEQAVRPTSMRGFVERKRPESAFAAPFQISLLKSQQQPDDIKHKHSPLSDYFSRLSLRLFNRLVYPRRVAIIGFGNVGLYIAYFFLHEGFSVCVYDSNSNSTDIQQVMEAELPGILNSWEFGKKLHHYSASDVRAILERFSVASDLSELVSKGYNVFFECISEVLGGKQQLFADLTELLHQRGVPARDILLCSCTQSVSIKSISVGVLAPYKRRLIGLWPSRDRFEVTYQGEEQPTMVAVRKLAHGIPVFAFEETAGSAKRARKVAYETLLQVSCQRELLPSAPTGGAGDREGHLGPPTGYGRVQRVG